MDMLDVLPDHIDMKVIYIRSTERRSRNRLINIHGKLKLVDYTVTVVDPQMTLLPLSMSHGLEQRTDVGHRR